MSYVMRENASLETCLDYAAQVAAGLAALPELQPLGAPWTTMRGDLRTARDARDDARYALTAARVRTRVHDAEWDDAVTNLSGHAYLAAGKNDKREPYASLFSGVKANDAVNLGNHKATVFGTTLLEKAESQKHPALKDPIQKLKKAQNALITSGEERVQANAALATHDVKRRQLIEAIEQLIDATEVGILTAFPGRRDLVQAILAPPRAAGRKRKKGEEPAEPETPAEPASVNVADLVDEPA